MGVDPFRTYDAVSMAEPCIMLADKNFSANISSVLALLGLVGMSIEEMNYPVVNVVWYVQLCHLVPAASDVVPCRKPY